MKHYLLDTNVLVRFLVGDGDNAKHAFDVFQKAENGKCVLVITDIALAESVWVLRSFYKIPRKKIAETLTSILHKPGIECPAIDCLIDALNRFHATNVDFIDCYLAAMSKEMACGVASFDRDLRKFKDIELWDQSTQK